MDYGAVGDGVTDDSSAVQTAITAMFNAGGGTLYFPVGNYNVSGGTVTTPATGIPYQLGIPVNNGTKTIALGFVGEVQPSGGTEQSSPPKSSGGDSMIYSTVSGASSTAIFSALAGTYAGQGLSNVSVLIDRLHFRGPAASTNTVAVDMSNAVRVVIGTIYIDTDTTTILPGANDINTGIGIQLTTVTSTLTNADFIYVSGYTTGIKLGGHNNINKLVLQFLYTGITFYGQASSYGQRIGHIDVQWTKTVILGGSLGSASFKVDLLQMSDEGTGNYALANIIDDASNFVYGTVYFASTQAAGAKFLRNGGAYLRFRFTSDWWVPTATLSTNPPVSGTIYRNTNNCDIIIHEPVTFNPTGAAAATLVPAVGPLATPLNQATESEPATTIVGIIRNYQLRVPAGWYYSFTVTNATLGTATIQVVP
jgi:hypothetical protein